MALTTGGFTTYDAIGNREDLSDMIYNIDPTDVPVTSAIGRGKASAVKHEWQTDTLAAATASNAHLEGDNVTPDASTPTVRLDNICQIVRKTCAVTGTQQAVRSAGRANEMAYQKAKRGKELKRDIQMVFLANQGKTEGSTTTPRTMRGLESWLTSNTDYGTGGADATAETAGAATATTGDRRNITEDQLKAVILSAYVAGGKPDTLYVPPVSKQRVSGFAGRSTARQNIGANQIQAAADLYASDFGDIKVVPNIHQQDRAAFLIDHEYLSLDYLRPIGFENLAKIGDSERGYMLAELTLCVKNEAAHAKIADLAA